MRPRGANGPHCARITEEVKRNLAEISTFFHIATRQALDRLQKCRIAVYLSLYEERKRFVQREVVNHV